MKVMVTGGYGLLGTAVSEELSKNKIDYIRVGHKDFDITDKDKTIATIVKYRPNVIIHCAAYTKVDRAETEREECYKVNVNGTYNIVEACKKIDAVLLFVSTDYVFSGEKSAGMRSKACAAPMW